MDKSFKKTRRFSKRENQEICYKQDVSYLKHLPAEDGPLVSEVTEIISEHIKNDKKIKNGQLRLLQDTLIIKDNEKGMKSKPRALTLELSKIKYCFRVTETKGIVCFAVEDVENNNSRYEFVRFKETKLADKFVAELKSRGSNPQTIKEEVSKPASHSSSVYARIAPIFEAHCEYVIFDMSSYEKFPPKLPESVMKALMDKELVTKALLQVNNIDIKFKPQNEDNPWGVLFSEIHELHWESKTKQQFVLTILNEQKPFCYCLVRFLKYHEDQECIIDCYKQNKNDAIVTEIPSAESPLSTKRNSHHDKGTRLKNRDDVQSSYKRGSQNHENSHKYVQGSRKIIQEHPNKNKNLYYGSSRNDSDEDSSHSSSGKFVKMRYRVPVRLGRCSNKEELVNSFMKEELKGFKVDHICINNSLDESDTDGPVILMCARKG